MNSISKVITGLVILVMVSGCAQDAYYKAITDQNIAISEVNAKAIAKQEEADRIHEDRMARLMTASMVAATQTPDKSDDVLIPLMYAQIEDKRVMSKALTANSRQPNVQQIAPPETLGDFIQKSTGLALGIGGVALGVVSSNNNRDILVGAMSGLSDANGIKVTDGSTYISDTTLGEGSALTLTNSYSTSDDHSLTTQQNSGNTTGQ